MDFSFLKPKKLTPEQQELRDMKKKAKAAYDLAFAKEELDIAAAEGKKAAKAKYQDESYKPKPKKSFFEEIQTVAGQAKKLENNVGGQLGGSLDPAKKQNTKSTEPPSSKDMFGF